MQQLTEGDIGFVVKVLFHPTIYPHIVGDGVMTKEDVVRMVYNPNFLLLSPNKYSLFIFEHRSIVVLEGHTSVLPKGRGKKCVEAGKRTIQWVWDNTSYRKIVGFTPISNVVAQKYNVKLGFTKEGVCSRSYLVKGELQDQIIFGINKEN